MNITFNITHDQYGFCLSVTGMGLKVFQTLDECLAEVAALTKDEWGFEEDRLAFIARSRALR